MLRPAGGVKKKKKSDGSSANNAAGIEFHKSKGQHILKNPNVVKAIVDKAGIKPTDTVLEIGPGTGNLTNLLLQQAKKVIAIEVDPRMVLELSRRFHGTVQENKLEIIKGDFLRIDLPYFDLCVANIPYNISSPLTFKLLAHRPVCRAAVIMYQHEFAMRMVAKPAQALYGRLAVNCQLLARVSHLLKVGKNNFRVLDLWNLIAQTSSLKLTVEPVHATEFNMHGTSGSYMCKRWFMTLVQPVCKQTVYTGDEHSCRPPPKVDSSVVRIEPRHPPPPVNFLEWDGFIRICFSRKNKTLGAIFKQPSTLALLHSNYELCQALSKASVAGTIAATPPDTTASMPENLLVVDDADMVVAEGASEDDAMDVDVSVESAASVQGKQKKGRQRAPAEFKVKVMAVLESLGHAESRSAKLAQEDFLALLAAFNSCGIHFA